MSGHFFNSEEKGSGPLPGRAHVLELTLFLSSSLSGVAGVHLYNGSFGLLQVGIPPETIKTYMSKVLTLSLRVRWCTHRVLEQ